MSAIAPSALYINGRDTARLGFVLDGVTGAFDAATRTDQLVDAPQAPGSILTPVPANTAPREIVVEGTVLGGTRAALETAKHQLKAICGTGTVQLRFVSVDTVFAARLVGVQAQHLGPILRPGFSSARLTLRFQCADPYGYDAAPSLVAFGSTPIAIPLGTAPSRGRGARGAVITICGAATTPTLTEYDAGGNVRRIMAFTWSPTAADALVIDLANGLVHRLQNGTRDNGLSLLTAGWEFPQLDPADGDYTTSAFPALGVSSGAGVVRYFRSWL